MFPHCGHFNQDMTICPKGWTASNTHMSSGFSQKETTADVMAKEVADIEPRIFISLPWFLQGYLYLSHSLSDSGKSFSLYGVSSSCSLVGRVVVVMAHRYYEPQCTALSPGYTFVNYFSLNSPQISQLERLFFVSTLTHSPQPNSCSLCKCILMVLILFILT